MSSGPDASGEILERDELDRFSPPMRDLLAGLLIYKSVFVTDWIKSIGHEREDTSERAFDEIARETQEEARRAVDLLKAWDAFPASEEVEAVTRNIRTHLVEDLLILKERSTEAFLSAGMRAPTEDLRRDFVALADMDRKHADVLRELLGISPLSEGAIDDTGRGSPGIHGVREGPFTPGTLARDLRETVRELRARGEEPGRIVLSDEAYRHLRDEDGARLNRGSFEDVPMDVDFGWRGEAYSIVTKARVSLAEITTAMRMEQGNRNES